LKVVLDANVFISALLSDGGTSAAAMNRALRKYTVILPEQFIRDVYSFAVQARKKKISMNPDEVIQALYNLRGNGIVQVVRVENVVSISPHDADNHYIQAAIDYQAQVIVTGDSDLTSENVRKMVESQYGVRILQPREFIECF